jgi:hypothetical protein
VASPDVSKRLFVARGGRPHLSIFSEIQTRGGCIDLSVEAGQLTRIGARRTHRRAGADWLRERGLSNRRVQDRVNLAMFTAAKTP